VDAAQTTLNAVLPAFFLIVAGVLAGRLFPELDMSTLTRLTVYFMIPALVFRAISTTALTLSAASLLALGYLLYLVILGFTAALGSRGLAAKERRGVLVTSLFGNTGNMGLPIALFAYGEAGLERGVIVFVLSSMLMFAVGPTLLASGTGLGERLWAALKLPPIWAALAGLAVNLLQAPVPLSLVRGVSLLGDAAIPVMLLSLGVQVYRSWIWDVGASALRSSFFRLVMGPLVAYAVGLAIGLRGLDLSVLVLMAAMPTAVTMFVLAVEVRGDYEGIARTVVATTLGSLAVITAVVFLLPP
jgi:malate permease and related proteins